MPLNSPAIDWNAIRPLNGSRADGFEELCAQLARAERPTGSSFERKGPPDAGVECYAVLGDLTEWGWQAKYFHQLGDSQLSQLDRSVKTALDKHPQLVRYFVCVPLDRPDPRIEGRSSAKDRWGQHVLKWEGWASDRGLTVEFVYWGRSELLECLARPEHAGRLRFWFDVRRFDRSWFDARLQEAINTAGPRYTPEIHVDLPIAGDLEAFGRTEEFFNRIKGEARKIRKKLPSFRRSAVPAEDTLEASESSLGSQVQAVLTALGELKTQVVGTLPFAAIAEQIAEALATTDQLSLLLAEREEEYDAQESKPDRPASRAHYSHNPFRERGYELQKLRSELLGTQKALSQGDSVAGRALMLLKGDVGTGKTHLLCDVAKRRVADGRPTVLLMGQRFTGTEEPWVQTLQQLDLSGLTAEEFVGALEAAAQAADSRALMLIDAINEGSGRQIWPSHMAGFLVHLERSEWIGVLLSVRSSYEEIIVPEEVRNRAFSTTHPGFAGVEYDATRSFFVHHGLELPSTPLLAPEFRNPLFLKTLCRGLQDTGQTRLPRGFNGITYAFGLYLDAINERLASSLNFDKQDRLVRRALERLAKSLVDSGQSWLPRASAKEVVDALLPGREFHDSLFHALIVEGVLAEDVARRPDSTVEDKVFVAYERLADHLVCQTLLDAHLDTDAPASAFAAGAPLAFLWEKRQMGIYLTQVTPRCRILGDGRLSPEFGRVRGAFR